MNFESLIGQNVDVLTTTNVVFTGTLRTANADVIELTAGTIAVGADDVAPGIAGDLTLFTANVVGLAATHA